MQVLLGILVLSFLVLLHELGHFIAAKLLKIPVLVFSIGFGKPLISKKVGETEYRLAPILFGGYVQMEGDEPGKKSETGFNSRPVWQRATVAIAGPLVNLITAFIFLFIMFLHGTPFAKYLDSTVVGYVAENSPAYGKIQAGDSIITINSDSVYEWAEADLKLKDLSASHNILFSRAGQIDSAVIEIDIPKPGEIDQFDHGMLPSLPAIIGSVSEDYPAYKAGLLVGDTVLFINEQKVSSWYDIPSIIASTCADSLEMLHFVVARKDSSQAAVSILPIHDEESGRFLVGCAPLTDVYLRKYDVSSAFVESKKKFSSYFFMIFDVLSKVAEKRISLGHLSGPLAIVMISGTAAQAGISALLNFMAMISINLGVLNLLPLVITDGGILSMLLVETIIRKPVPEKVQQYLATAFTVLFIALFIFVSIQDIQILPKLVTK